MYENNLRGGPMYFYDAKVSSLFTNKKISLSQLFMTKNSQEDSLTPTRGWKFFVSSQIYGHIPFVV